MITKAKFSNSPNDFKIRLFGLNNIYSDKVHDIQKYNIKIVGSDSKPVAYLDHLLDML